MNATRHSSVAALSMISVFAVSVIGRECLCAAQELPDPKPLLNAKGRLGQALKDMTDTERTRERFVGDLRELPQCAQLLSRVTSAYEETARTGLRDFKQLSEELDALLSAVRPISDVQQEARKRNRALAQLEANIVSAKATQADLEATGRELTAKRNGESERLLKIQQGQKDAIADWLWREYAQKPTSPSVPMEVGRGLTVSMNTLFGTLTAQCDERTLAPGQEATTTVTFTPAIFTKELFLDQVDLGPDDYDPQKPRGLDLAEGKVSAEGPSRGFKLKQKERITPDNPITWTWSTRALEEFNGADFKIAMNALRREGNRELTVGRLPIRIARTPSETLLERFQDLIGAIVGPFVGFVLGMVNGPWCWHALRAWWARRRARRNAEKTLPGR